MSHGNKIWALLIGVESYFPGTERSIQYPRLNGCVRDIEAVGQYLRQLGVKDIKTLTASGHPTPTEKQTELPIYQNILREFKYITDNASRGDIVYFHYSGHGIGRNTSGSEQDTSGDNITGTALALADVMAGGAYLTGYHLGVLVKKMVKGKGLRVTVVLDSCFSGQGLRSNMKYTIRSCPGSQLDNSVLQSDKILDEIVASIDTSIGSLTRKAQLKRSWWSSPTGCTVLTACQFDEAASEGNFPGEDGPHGVLTYWLLRGLQQNPFRQRPTHAKLKEYVATNITQMKPRIRQSPVLHGDGDYVFLGSELVIERPVVRILSQYEDYIELDVGKAQGVAVGAVYDIYPEFNQTAGTASIIQACIVDVSDNPPFRATAELATREQTSIGPTIGTKSAAILQTWALPSDTFIDVSLPIEHRNESQIEKLRDEIEQTPGLILLEQNTTSKSSFAAVVNSYNEFEVLVDGRQLPRVPRICIEDEKWIQKLSYVFNHLARFQALNVLPDDFTAEAMPSDWFIYTAKAMSSGPIPQSNGKYFVQGGKQLILSLKLSETCPLEFVYVSFYNFSSAWGIHKIYPGPGQASAKLPKKRLERFGITVDVPPAYSEDGPGEIEDTIRAFISTNEVSWEEIILPDLPLGESSIPDCSANEFTVLSSEHNISEGLQNAGQNTASARNVRSFIVAEDRLGFLDIVIQTTNGHTSG
ncbi:hypothetical protein TWF730_010250 [Orbilia blumenaviensis]|uniref:Peptidase C14 caspase domain-containing protein n=1 Tax=Orbilia blumenaviensis TaxID=1796055 RepID=A0AAV9UR62_9PEZI